MKDSANRVDFWKWWPKTMAGVVLLAGALGLWLALAEIASYYIPGAFFAPEGENAPPKIFNPIFYHLDMPSVLDNLMGFVFSGMILGLIGSVVYFPLAEKIFSRGRDQSRREVLTAVGSILMLLAILFYIPPLTWGPFLASFPWAWTVKDIIGWAIALVFLGGQFYYYRGRVKPGFLSTLALQGVWIMAGLVGLTMVNTMVHDHSDQLGAIIRLPLSLLLAAFCYLGFRLSRLLARRLKAPARFRAVFIGLIMVLSYGLFGYNCYFYEWGYKRIPGPNAGPARGPNLIMVVWDTVRADHLSCYGYHRPTTPFLDQIAREGVKFTRAYAVAPSTLPSHASFFTGLFPSEHHCNNGNFWLDDRFETLAEKLQAAGYVTLGFSCNPLISKSFNLRQGFDLLLQPRQLFIEPPVFAGEDIWRLWIFSTDPKSTLLDSGDAQANGTVKYWLKTLAAKRAPFFVFINYMAAHRPYPSHKDAYRFFPDPSAARKEIAKVHFNRTDQFTGLHTFTPDQIDLGTRRYDGGIYYLDRLLQDLARALENNGLAANTVVVILSDHGESLGEHGLWGHNFGMYHSLLHVPLIIWYPAMFPQGVEHTEMFSLHELPELTLGILSGKAPRIISSPRSGQEGGGRGAPIFAERHRHPDNIVEPFKNKNPNIDVARFDRDQKSVIVFPYHLIWDSQGRDELYRIDLDPFEINNLVDVSSDTYHELSVIIERFRIDHPEPSAGSGGKKLDADTIRKLRALGYVK